MIKQLSISYESVQQNSYLAVACGNEQNVIHYQLEMITSNEVSHFLNSRKQIRNGEIIVYYQISSKIPLGQMLERNKIQKAQVLCIMEGAIQAMKDALEYQLNLKGLVMDADYIYVNPSTFEPHFIYLPLVSADETDICSFLRNLVMQGKIAMTNDNFIQVLLDMINSPSFSLEEMEAFIKQFRGAGQEKAGSRNFQMPGDLSLRGQGNISVMQQQGTPPSIQKDDQEPTILVNPDEPQLEYPNIPSILPQPPIYEQPPIPPALPKSEKKKKKEKPVKKGSQVPGQEDEGDFDRERAKKIFLLPQAFVMVGLAALISFGAFTDNAGHIVLNNILAALIIIAVAEVVLYREAYVNNKKKTVKGSGKGKKNLPDPSVQPPVMPNHPKYSKPVAVQPMPPKFNGVESGSPIPPKFNEPVLGQRETPMFNGTASQPVQSQFNGAVASSIAQRLENGNAMAKIPVSMADDSDDPQVMQNTETEIWDESPADGEIYLEYYENGMFTRVILNKPRFLIGRLKGQVDFVVSNTKVGKIHAEFLVENGVVYVKDFNSKNGTYINGNGERIQSNIPYPLKDKDRVSLANSEFTLRCPVN